MMNSERMPTPATEGTSPRELWFVVLKRKWIMAGGTLAVLTAVGLISFLMTPTYTARGLVLIEPEPNILSFEEIFRIEPLSDDYFQTHYKLLQSRVLAGDTIDRMRLEQNAAFVRSAVKDGAVRADDPKSAATVRGKLIDAFLRRLAIQPVSKTRLIQASFSDRDPRLAADVLNALFDAYVEMNVQRKYQATEQATDFLSDQISSVQSEIEANEKKLQEYGQEKNIIALNSRENTVIEKLAELNKALTDAQIDRVNKETYYNEIRLATPDYIPDALSNPLIQKLREEYNKLNREYVTRSEKYLPDYPEIQSLKVQVESAKKAMEDETQALIKRAHSDYQAALTKEQTLSGVFDAQKREAFQLNSNAIEYNSLQIQIQNEKNLLESLMKRKSETDVSARLKGLRTSNIWVVDKAETPTSPSRPNKKRNMILGLIVGLFAGLGLALTVESLDVTVKHSDDISRYAGMRVLGMVPAFSRNGTQNQSRRPRPKEREEPEGKGNPAWAHILEQRPSSRPNKTSEAGSTAEEVNQLIVHFSPKSSCAEHYRSIRTTLLLAAGGAEKRSLGVMSPLPEEGKTTTLCNLGIVLAQAGKRVVIIDADLRKPQVHRVFKVKNLRGLTKFLTTDVAISDLTRATPIPGLFFINSGPVPPNPLELLGSEKAAVLISQLKDSFDFVLVDTPPILPVSDALVIGVRLDGAILVVRGGKTPRKALREARDRLETHKINAVGVIVNGIPTRGFEDYYYSRHAYYEGRVVE